MKKIVMLLCCAFVLIFSVSACGTSQKDLSATDIEPSTTVQSSTSTPEPAQIPSYILTVSKIKLSGISKIDYISFVDEKGVDIDMPVDWDDWFENAITKKVNLTGEINMKLNSSGAYDFALIDGTKFLFVFEVEGDNKEYSVGVCEGSKFAVQKNADGKYILLPEETVLLSPAPVVVEKSEKEDKVSSDTLTIASIRSMVQGGISYRAIGETAANKDYNEYPEDTEALCNTSDGQSLQLPLNILDWFEGAEVEPEVKMTFVDGASISPLNFEPGCYFTITVQKDGIVYDCKLGIGDSFDFIESDGVTRLLIKGDAFKKR